VILLLNLELEVSFHGCEDLDLWKSKWEHLRRTAKSLKRIASGTEKHIHRDPRGPIALPTLLPTNDGDAEEKQRAEYSRSLQANGRLVAIVAGLRESALEIEHFCRMQRDWVRKMPQKYRDIVRRERNLLLLRFVESSTGKPHFEDLAALLNICKSVAHLECNGTEFSADNLRKLAERFSTPLIKQIYPDR
jgi:hypothetical protein